jgi:non-ribosomal peptide synthetase-like protein
LALVVIVPRLLNLALKPDKAYSLYGFHYSVLRTIERLTNLKFFTHLFGDSSYIVYYLRAIGYKLPHVEQTGSNFGVEVKHETPFLIEVGRGTMVSDGFSVVNTEFSSTSFRVSRTCLGKRNFLGNAIVYPSRSRTGDDCLLATKVAVPIEGEIREGVGLLGSPCFEIPRSVERDRQFDHLKSGGQRRRRLAAKNRHNTVTLVLYLFLHWVHFVGVTMLAQVLADLYSSYGTPVVAADIGLTLLFSVVYFVLAERLVFGFRGLRPRFCSIYDRYFWRHERFWKLSTGTYLAMFNGTPFKNLLWRLLGMRIGHRVFDDGAAVPEKSLVSIGSDCMLNAGSVIQCHSLEDGTFKSGRTTIGAGCTLGTHAFVHYGVSMGERTVLEADSFLMKGEETLPHARWRGNPANDIPDGTPAAIAAPAGHPALRTASPDSAPPASFGGRPAR